MQYSAVHHADIFALKLAKILRFDSPQWVPKLLGWDEKSLWTSL